MKPFASLCQFRKALFLAALFMMTTSFVFTPAFSHCDGLDGPVVASARLALQSGNINQVLIWVRPEDENEIKQAFDEARAVRKLSPQAERLADRSFYETLVRVHRAGEGAPYTGMKPAGRDLGPAIPAADKAIIAGTDEKLVQLLTKEMQDGIAARFRAVMEKKHFDANDLAAGRAYVEAYVGFIHYAERLHEAAEKASGGHYAEE
jgi:Family of unknown function (DUF6448)